MMQPPNKGSAPKSKPTPTSSISVQPQVAQGPAPKTAIKPAIANEPMPIKPVTPPVIQPMQTPELSHKPPVTPQGPMTVPNMGNPPRTNVGNTGRFNGYSTQVTPGKWNQR